MTRTIVIVLGAALLAATAGCGGTHYHTLSSHTVALATDRESDVVWLEDDDGRVYRCAPGAGPTVCERPGGLH